MGIKLWRVSDSQLLKTIEGNASGVSSLVFSSDGQTLASGNEDGTVMLWPVHP
jgi:WD40 repeat protein